MYWRARVLRLIYNMLRWEMDGPVKKVNPVSAAVNGCGNGKHSETVARSFIDTN